MELYSTVEPKILVLMTAYNGRQWIDEQVKSILAQEGVKVTLFISVDLSGDGTSEWVSSLADRELNVFMLPYGKRYGGAGENFFRMIKEVSFEGYDYVAFADQDDIWLSRKLLRAYEVMQIQSVDVVSSDVIAFWPDGKKKVIKKSYPQREYDHFFEAAGPGCTYLFSVSAASAFKSFVEAVGDRLEQVSLHDWLAYAFCRANHFKWYVDHKPLMLYRQHNGNQVGSNTGLYAYLRRFHLIRSRWYRKQVEMISALVSPNFDKKIHSRGFLVRNFMSLRRRPRDQVILLLMILFGFF
ncbi:glycosyltransferase [Pseudomonas sp. MAFF 302030]|uniref:Glycosyltransferase n=1 Tax=Pseudomonas morbosilactucae TaxID=2938197 RepID=A0A9X1Z0Q7_9PSED|nr:glycosyltransferase [Pseudomonas morbosilactucae]MCK9801675.1 glycosyltransferase [Pseudomonas morbosilactucae]